MMRSIALLSVAAFAAIALMPSASAMEFVAPPAPNPTCPVTPQPTEGGVIGAVKQIAHDETYAACQSEGQAEVIAAAGYTLAMNEVGAVVRVISPFVDESQDNVCDFLYGDHDHSGELGCSEIVVDGRALGSLAALNLPPLPEGF
jgi:hypothetical protein